MVFLSSLSQDQTTWSVFILWIIFDHFSIAEEFLGFFYTNTTNNALINSMFGKLELPGLNFLLYLVDQRHTQFRSSGLVYSNRFELANV